MNNYLFFHHFTGLAITIFLQGLLGINAKIFFGTNWVFGYLTILLTTASTLTLCSLVSLPSLPTILIFLFFTTAFFGWKNRPRPFVQTDFIRQNAPYLLILGLFFVYAGFPDFRTDQWTYHLMVAKKISLEGKLQGPILNDHIFFTGIYEYLFLFGRSLTSSDIANQSFADSFTFSTLCISLTGLVQRLYQNGYGRNQIPPGAWVVFIIFSLPTFNMVTNAKPDPLLFSFAWAVITLFAITQKDTVDRSVFSFFLGLFLIAPVGLKISWIHFMGSFIIFVGMMLYRSELNLNRKLIIIGMLAGSVLTLPYFVKNYLFFGNPMHPLQFGPLSSAYWSEQMQEYWRQTNGRPTVGYELIAHFFGAIVRYTAESKYFLIPTAIVTIPALFRLQSPKFFQQQKSPLLFILIFVCLLLWPFFYKSTTYVRFLYPIFAPLAFVTFANLSNLHSKKLLQFALVIPLFLNGSIEVRLSKVIKNLFVETKAFYEREKSPMFEWIDYSIINQHRAQNSHSKNYNSHTVLTDSNTGYFSDRAIHFIRGYDFPLLREKSHPCIWRFLSDQKISYLYSATLPFAQWPEELKDVIGEAAPIDDNHRIRYLPESLISKLNRKYCHP